MSLENRSTKLRVSFFNFGQKLTPKRILTLVSKIKNIGIIFKLMTNVIVFVRNIKR